MGRDIDISELLEQSVKTVEQYFHRAEWQIDAQFGEGFAKKNPALVAEFVRASSADFNTAVMKPQDIREGLSR